MIDNILVFEQEKEIPSRKYVDVITLELERFASRIEVEMSNDDGDNIHIELDIEQAKKLVEFIGGFIGMVSA